MSGILRKHANGFSASAGFTRRVYYGAKSAGEKGIYCCCRIIFLYLDELLFLGRSSRGGHSRANMCFIRLGNSRGQVISALCYPESDHIL